MEESIGIMIILLLIFIGLSVGIGFIQVKLDSIIERLEEIERRLQEKG